MEKSKEYANKSLIIKETTKTAFDKAKKDKTTDEFISELLKLYQERKNIELQIKTLKEENTKLKNERVSQPQPAPGVETPTTDTSTEASKVTELTTPIESVKVGGQQCDFYTFNDKKQLVECMMKFTEKNEILRVTQQVCDKCWNNIQSKKEQVKEDQSLPAPNSPSGVRLESKPSNENEKWTSTEQRAIELAYETTKAKERAKAEGLAEQNRLKEEDRKAKERHRNQNRESSIDMGDSAGVPENYIFNE